MQPVQVGSVDLLPSLPVLLVDWSLRYDPFAAGTLGTGYPRRVEKRGSALRFAGVADSCLSVGVLSHNHSLGQRQGQAEVHLAVVQNVGFELDALGGLVQVLK